MGFDFGCGEALRQQGENVPKLLVGQSFPSCGKFQINSNVVLLHKKAVIALCKISV